MEGFLMGCGIWTNPAIVIILLVIIGICLFNVLYCRVVNAKEVKEELFSFAQYSFPYNPQIFIPADISLMSGYDESYIKSWLPLDYYKSYELIYGPSREGKEASFPAEHSDMIQRKANGDIVQDDRFFKLVPTREWTQHLTDRMLAFIEAGGTGIHVQEAEYSVSTGYSEAFKREWRDFYGNGWQDHSFDMNAKYMAGRLKGALFARLTAELFESVKESHPDVRTYAAMHSIQNYARWGYVFSYDSLVKTESIDAVVAQVWTDTMRPAISYEGVSQTRFFEHGYLEYSFFVNLMKNVDKELWFLGDPAGDDINHTWSEFRESYIDTVVAQLLFPEVRRYGLIPWPKRVFQLDWIDPVHIYEKEVYTNQLLSAFEVLREQQNIPEKDCQIEAGTEGIGIVIGDSLLWRSLNTEWFYGLSLPLLMDGIPIEVIPIERVAEYGYLDEFKILIVDYDRFNPLTAKENEALADWAKQGGTLILIGNGNAQEYSKINEWWQDEGFRDPIVHLLALLECGQGRTVLNEIPRNSNALYDMSKGSSCLAETIQPFSIMQQRFILSGATGVSQTQVAYCVGEKAVIFDVPTDKGYLVYAGIPGEYFSQSFAGARLLRDIMCYACEKLAGINYIAPGYLRIDRGEYTAVAALSEDVIMEGYFMDVFDHELSIVRDPKVEQGNRALFVNVSKAMSGMEESNKPRVLFAGTQLQSLKEGEHATEYIALGPEGTYVSTRMLCNGQKPKTVMFHTGGGKEHYGFWVYDDKSDTVLLRYPADADGVLVKVEWGRDVDLPHGEYGCSVSRVLPETEGDRDKVSASSKGAITLDEHGQWLLGDDSEIIYDFPASGAKEAYLYVQTSNNYKVEAFKNGWRTVAASTEFSKDKVFDSENLGWRKIDLTPFLPSKTIRIRLSDTSGIEYSEGSREGLFARIVRSIAGKEVPTIELSPSQYMKGAWYGDMWLLTR
jgi:hypothetical protein